MTTNRTTPEPIRRRTRRLLAGGAALVVAAIAVLTVGGGGSPTPTTADGRITAPATTEDPAGPFFAGYVDADGRVVRRDQGGDTVSEGQAYALLLALAAGDHDRFSTVWDWTRTNLQRPDGLFAWRWSGGQVANSSPAADADLDIARALLAAGERFGRPELTTEGLRVAEAILEHETVERGGRLSLSAGPWASAAAIVNPSYLAPCAFTELAEATGDDRWRELRDDSVALLREFLAGGGLPPDWGRLDDGGRLVPTGPPDHRGGPARYGLDAARVPLRFAETCDGGGEDLAAGLWPQLAALPDRGARTSYALDGTSPAGDMHPLGLTAAAAAAAAAGDESAAAGLLAEADRLAGERPTYYGAAWVTLSRLILADIDPGKQRAITFNSGVLRLIATAEPGAAPETTTTSAPEPTTTTAPTAPTTTEPPTTTTRRETTTSTTGPATTTTTVTGEAVPPQPTTTTEPHGGAPPADPLRPGRLSAPAAPLDRLLNPTEDPTRTPEEEAVPRRTGTLLGGLAAAATTGLLLGLRDRRMPPLG